MSNDIYSAFGNSVRVKLITCLSKSSTNVSDLIDNCGLTQSAVSQHLKKLKNAGLVKSEKNGKEVFYSLKYKTSEKIAKDLINLERRVKNEKYKKG